MQKPTVIVEILTAIELCCTDKWTATDGTEGYGSAPNIIADVVYEKLIDIGYSEKLANAIAEDAQAFVEHFVVDDGGDLTYK